MADISTRYAGLELRSPIIVASSGLTQKFEKIREFAQAGAGAVVLKSIFEEQMENEVAYMSNGTDFPEAMEYLSHYVHSHAIDNHIQLMRRCKDELDIPIIPSINCYKADTWMGYAESLVGAGASAIELNVMRLESSMAQEWGAAETNLCQLVSNLKKNKLGVPVIIKLSKYYTNVIRLARDLKISGADGIVIFNRMFAQDINIEKETLSAGPIFSSENDLYVGIRFAGLIRGAVPDLSFAVSSGVRSGIDAIKCLLAGADAVQMCTALYQNGARVITEANQILDAWMDEKQYHNISEIRGRLAATRADCATLYERTQFMKYFSTYDPTPTNTFGENLKHPDLPH